VLTLIEGSTELPADDREKAESTRAALVARHGYADSSLRDALGELLKDRYPP
jgi:hypothetical protein